MKRIITLLLSVILSACSIKINLTNDNINPEPKYYTINNFEEFKQQFPIEATQIEANVDYFLNAVNMDRTYREFNESYHYIDGEIDWELYADISDFKTWKCYAEMKEENNQVVMNVSYINFTTPDKVDYDLLQKMARVMGYNALQITKLYENYLEEYQTEGRVRQEIQLDKYNKVVFAYTRSPNGNSLMIDMIRNL